MAEVSMDGRVAIVTGAGRALGRAYALLLAARGASVVVNDLGTDPEGGGHDASLAEAVVEEIRAAGGKAVADSSNVATEAGGKAVVERAITAFGRIDAVVANAGIHMAAPFEDTSLADFGHQIDNAVSGTVAVLHAAWPHFKAQGYGRVVTTGSGGGIFGLAGVSAYGAAKGAVQGLTRVLAIEGKPHGVLVNMIAPGAFSRMAGPSLSPADLERARNLQPPELVAPVVLWLASERCHVTGEAFSSWAGRVSRLVVGGGRGLIDRNLTAETIDEQYATIASRDGLYEPVDILDELNKWMVEIK
jgi:NAD(P)-dependent dehydrogenase (short-subunit alcohol dehydrogenase family)